MTDCLLKESCDVTAPGFGTNEAAPASLLAPPLCRIDGWRLTHMEGLGGGAALLVLPPDLRKGLLLNESLPPDEFDDEPLSTRLLFLFALVLSLYRKAFSPLAWRWRRLSMR